MKVAILCLCLAGTACALPVSDGSFPFLQQEIIFFIFLFGLILPFLFPRLVPVPAKLHRLQTAGTTYTGNHTNQTRCLPSVLFYLKHLEMLQKDWLVSWNFPSDETLHRWVPPAWTSWSLQCGICKCPFLNKRQTKSSFIKCVPHLRFCFSQIYPHRIVGGGAGTNQAQVNNDIDFFLRSLHF